MALRIEREAGASESERAVYAFRLCLTRKPTPAELDRVLAFYRGQFEHFKSDPEAARKVVGAEKDKVASTAGAPSTPVDVDLAAWTMVSNVLLNLDDSM